jgi:hypothetical protein
MRSPHLSRHLVRVGAVVLIMVPGATAAAQTRGWNDSITMALVQRAANRRATEIADSSLIDYRATARGFVTFLGQFGDARGELSQPPKLIRADELALEVYWRAPDRSKQLIVGRRDTLLAPTDINYHRDHLGIVQNNFPNTIRLGEGDEVLDVAHPLAVTALSLYDYQIADSLTLRLPDRTIDVYQVQVRPRDPDHAAVVGAVYLDRTTAEVVRMAFNFTHAAYLDPQLEDVSVVLENALVNGRFWLPRHQEIEIRRAGTWLDFPVRGVIRGSWDICCYVLNSGLDPRLFAGSEIEFAPLARQREYAWTGSLLDSLPADARAVTDADVARVQEEARALVRERALGRGAGSQLSVRRMSDFVRVNRAEGLALGAGARARVGPVSIGMIGRYGISDEKGKGRLSLRWRESATESMNAELFAERAYRDASDVAETSLPRNTIASQEFGSDYTDPFDVRALGLGIGWRALSVRWRIEAAWEQHDPVRVNAPPPFTGSYEPTLQAWSIASDRLSLFAEWARPTTTSGVDARWSAELRLMQYTGRDTVVSGGRQTATRARVQATVSWPLSGGSYRLISSTLVAGIAGPSTLPPQELVLLGGPVTGPGYEFHQFATRFGAAQRLEWHSSVPFPSISLGRFGRSPATATVAPFVNVMYAGDATSVRDPHQGWFPALGVGGLFLFDLLRVDVARGLRDGRWTFSLDVASELWGVL